MRPSTQASDEAISEAECWSLLRLNANRAVYLVDRQLSPQSFPSSFLSTADRLPSALVLTVPIPATPRGRWWDCLPTPSTAHRNRGGPFRSMAWPEFPMQWKHGGTAVNQPQVRSCTLTILWYLVVVSAFARSMSSLNCLLAMGK